MTNWELAIDFGTSNTTAAVRTPDGRIEVVEVDNSRYVPSVVYLEHDGTMLAGQRASARAAQFPERAERLPKRALASSTHIRIGGRTVGTAEVVAVVLAKMVAEARRRFQDQPPARVVLTHPAAWGPVAQGRLAEAARIAGLAKPEFVAEPVAAATYYADGKVTPGALIGVYDLGGGTFDTAVLRRTPTGFELVGPPGGDANLGGEDVDEALMEVVGAHAEAVDGPAWLSITTAAGPSAQRDRSALRGDVVSAKHTLSEKPTAYVYVPGLPDEVHLTRRELEQAIAPLLQRTVRELQQTVARAGTRLADLTAVYLTGGASRMPCVSEQVAAALGGRLPTVQGDPKAVVAIGALIRIAPVAAPPQPQPRPVAVAQDDRQRQAPKRLWTVPLDIKAGLADVTPVIGDGVAIVSHGPGTAAIGLADGAVRWTSQVYSERPAAIASGRVLLRLDGRVVALDATTGAQVWQHRLAEEAGEHANPTATIEIAGASAFVPFSTGVSAISIGQGRGLWHTELSTAAVCVCDGLAYATSSTNGGMLEAIEAASGNIRWRWEGGGGELSAPTARAGVVYVGGADGIVRGVVAHQGMFGMKGREIWRAQIGAPLVAAPVCANGLVYVGSRDGSVIALEPGSGRVRWSCGTGDQVNATPLVADGLVFVSTGTWMGVGDNTEAPGGFLGFLSTLIDVGSSLASPGKLCAIDANNGREKWSIDLRYGTHHSRPAYADGRLFFAGRDGHLMAIDAKTGEHVAVAD
ncbi:PQQ-binding-like beta-propeller repeat protein [Dactylosporangium sp. NPDC000521]|uniref:outer membrane protein assembly factor BamB family protein n=1 Tax=Dactylosporangium sp. NPDC000521 TaxID=3363975 RepID=UPI00368EB51A